MYNDQIPFQGMKNKSKTKREDYIWDFETVVLEYQNQYSGCHRTEINQVIVGSYPCRDFFSEFWVHWSFVIVTVIRNIGLGPIALQPLNFLLFCLFICLFMLVRVNVRWMNCHSNKFCRFHVFLERWIRKFRKGNCKTLWK